MNIGSSHKRFIFISKLLKHRGATMVEFSLIFGVCLMAIAATLEISRYMAIRGVVQQGAQRGLILASRIEDLQHEQGDPKFDKFIEARRMVLTEAADLPSSSFLPESSSNAHTRLMSFTLNDVNPPQTADAILLRPGERFTSEDGVVFDHPTICSETPPACTNGAAPRDPFVTTETLMQNQNHPIVVIVRARIEPLFPILPEFFAQGVAAGFREDFRRTLYNKPPPNIPPSNTPTPVPPSPSPSITPDPAHSPTITPIASPTPTRTPTVTRTPTFFPCNCSPVQEAGCHDDHTCTICPNSVNQCICARDRTLCQTGGG